MSFLKKLPISFTGELHHIQLVNFSVEREEIETQIPEEIKVRLINGRAMISMVNVELKRMHPVFLSAAIKFNYRHVAFRLLVDDLKLNIEVRWQNGERNHTEMFALNCDSRAN